MLLPSQLTEGPHTKAAVCLFFYKPAAMRQQPLEKEHRNYLRFYNQQLRILVKESREATANFHDQVIVNPNIEYATQKLHNTVIGPNGCVYTVIKAHGTSLHEKTSKKDGKNGQNDSDESPIGVLWTRSEKEKFFTALARYSIHNLASIKAHLPNKSEVEILNYYHLLKSSLKNYQKKKKTSKKLLKYDDFPIAYEMSEYFTDLENGQADLAIRDENREILREKTEANVVDDDPQSSTESLIRTQEDAQSNTTNTTNTIDFVSNTVPGGPNEEDNLFIKENITELTKFLTQNNNLEALKDKMREQLDFKNFFYSPTAVIDIVPPLLSLLAEDVLKQLVRAYITKLLHKVVQSKLANYHLGERMDDDQDVNVEIDDEDVRRALYYENTRVETGRNVRNMGNINPLYNKVYLSNMQKNLNIKLEPEHHRRPATFQAKIFEYLDFMISARWLRHLESVNILAYNNFDYFEKLFPQRKFGLLFVKFLKKNNFNIVDCGKVGLPIGAKEYREAVFSKKPKGKLLEKKSVKDTLEVCNKVDNDEENTDISSNFSNDDSMEEDLDEEDSDEELDIGPAVHVSNLKKTNSKQYKRQPGTDYYTKLAYKYPTLIDIDSQMLGDNLTDSDFTSDENADEGLYDETATEKNALPFIVDDNQSTQELDNAEAIKEHFRETGKLDRHDKEVSTKYQKMILRYLNLYNTDPEFTFFVSEPPRSVKGNDELKRVRRQARGSESIVKSYLVRRKQYETYIASYKRLLKWLVDSKRRAFHLANFKAFVVLNPTICQEVMANEDNWRVLKTEENIWNKLKQLFILKMLKHVNFQFKYDEEMDYDLSNSAVAGGSLREAITVAREFGLRVPQPLVEIINREQKQEQEKQEQQQQQQQHQIGKEPSEAQFENHEDGNNIEYSYNHDDGHNLDLREHLVKQGFDGTTSISSHQSSNISGGELGENVFDVGSYGRDYSKDQGKDKIAPLNFNFRNIDFKGFDPDEVNLDEYTFGPGDDLYSSLDAESSLDGVIGSIDGDGIGESENKFEHVELKRRSGGDDDDGDFESDNDADVMPALKKLKTADGGLQNTRLEQSQDFPIY